jgi:phage baseplate assembly protein W
MAIRVTNKSALEISKRVAIGVAIPFNSADVFKLNYTTVDQMKSNIINFILTNKGERILNPNFGSNLREFLFEGINESTLKALEIKLTNDIQNNFPNVTINSLTLNPLQDDNTIQLSLSLSVYNGDIQTIQILL